MTKPGDESISELDREAMFDRLYERCTGTRDNLKMWLRDARMSASKKAKVARLILQFDALAKKFERKDA